MPGPYAGVGVILLINSIVTCPGNSCRFSLPCGTLIFWKKTGCLRVVHRQLPAATPDNGHTRCRCGRMGEWKDTDRPVLANARATLAMQEYFKVVPRTTGANPHSDLTFTAVP